MNIKFKTKIDTDKRKHNNNKIHMLHSNRNTRKENYPNIY